MGTAGWPVLLAACAACAIGTGAALQQQAAHGVSASGSAGIGLIGILLRRPIWLLGVAVMVTGFGLQAAALDLGRLAVVEPILATSLVVALVVAAFRHRSWPGPADWLAMVLAAGGVAVFLVVAAPVGGRAQPPAVWWAPLLVGLGLLGVLALWRSPHWLPARTAMGLGAVAGMTIGASDALVKATVSSASVLHLAVLMTLPPYLLVIVGAAGFLLQQHAYRVGELKSALPASSVLEPLTGTVLGLTLFGERLAAHDPLSAIALMLAAAATIVGVWRLGGAPLLEARVHPDALITDAGGG
jgi:hypothetical protein